MKIRGYLIDPDAAIIVPVRVEQHEVGEYRRLIRCDCMDSAPVFDGNRAWVDDEGILVGKTPFAICDPHYRPFLLFGRTLILGSNPPDCVDARCSIDAVRHYTLPVKALDGDGETGVVIADLEANFELVEREPA